MQIQASTDNIIERHEPLARHVQPVVEEAPGKFSEQIARVVVHLSETNDSKCSSGDHRCLMEARIEGPPIATSDHAASPHQAIHGAAEKLKRSIDSIPGRINDIVAGPAPMKTKSGSGTVPAPCRPCHLSILVSRYVLVWDGKQEVM